MESCHRLVIVKIPDISHTLDNLEFFIILDELIEMVVTQTTPNKMEGILKLQDAKEMMLFLE